MKLIFVVSEDYYFFMHWLPLAVAAKDKGFDVSVVTRCRAHHKAIEEVGIKVFSFEMDRRGLNPFILFFEVMALARILRSERPDLLHLLALRPLIVGGLAARLACVRRVLFSLTGMGYLFTGSGPVWARLIIERILSLLLARGLTIVQNSDDLRQLVSLDIPPTRIRLIPGATGIDTARFRPQVPRDGALVVMMAARLLWDKGVGEFVRAANLLKHSNARFVLVGSIDSGNPESISNQDIDQWVNKGFIEWWGHSDEMPSVLAQADIVCLPSYREGLPVVLLEAMACAKPCIATDVPGCREAVLHEFNGLLVPPRDDKALSLAITRLLERPDIRMRMGLNGRERIMKEFSQAHVIRSTLELYCEINQ
uniref:glycosyltransferase family 4 protein n=1 Tax=Polynucleobacter sp. TaxID=2029855 RepID=UPI004047E778